jgi:hypothetical protein
MFQSQSRFQDSEFRGQASFVYSLFGGDITFASALFKQGASFAFARFFEPESLEPVDLTELRAQKEIAFENAYFGNSVDAERLEASSLTLVGAEFGERALISVAISTIDDLRMSVNALNHVPEEERLFVLALLEKSAKRRNDLGLANDVHYRYLEVRARDKGTIMRTLDAIFYRGVAGYFVRPLHPLVSLIAAIGVFSLWRTMRRERSRVGSPSVTTTGSFSLPRSRSGFNASLGRVAAWGGRLQHEVAHRVSAAFRWRSAPPVGVSRLEIMIYRVLIVCFLLAVATDPEFRDFVDLFR